jgi:hypothetical protein
MLRWEAPRSFMGIVPAGTRPVEVPVGEVRSSRVGRVGCPFPFLAGAAGITLPFGFALWWLAELDDPDLNLCSRCADCAGRALPAVVDGALVDAKLIGTEPVCPPDNPKTGARALALGEVEQPTEDFITAAVRADRAGFDGVEIHGAHGCVIAQFLSAGVNRRTDRYGGSPENRARPLFDVVAGIRARGGDDTILAARLSPERFGRKLAETRTVAQRLMSEGMIDLLDMSLRDVFKEPQKEELQGRSLLAHFAVSTAARCGSALPARSGAAGMGPLRRGRGRSGRRRPGGHPAPRLPGAGGRRSQF